jgi:hypothetical protein
MAFDYDEDTMSLVEDPTRTIVETLLLTTQISLLGTHPSLLNINAMKLRLMHLNLIIMDQKA